MARAILYNKHTPLIDLEIDGLVVKKINEVIDHKFLPIILQDNLNLETLNFWIERRMLPQKREKIDYVKTYFAGFDNFGNMFSLSDQYWFKFNKNDNWENLNFFTNDYCEDVGKMFMAPWDVNRDCIGLPSPDLATNGVLMKRWVKEDDGFSYLIKTGSKVYHQDPLSEVLASITLKKLDFLPFVEYKLVVDCLKFCSKCKNFITEDTEFVPASYIYTKEKRDKKDTIYDHMVKMCSIYGIEGSRKYMDNMITADSIIGNDDRHLGNFGFLRNVNTGKIIGFAPLFDSGSAYWGKAESSRKSRIFYDHEQESIYSVINDKDLDVIYDHDEMFEIINMYPQISAIKRDDIKSRIIKSENNLKKNIELVKGNKNIANKPISYNKVER